MPNDINDNTMKCKLCDQVFPSVRTFYKHQRVIHRIQRRISGNLQYACKKCAQKFSKKALLQNHLKTKHLFRKSVKHQASILCSVEHCSRKFNTYEQLKCHLKNTHKLKVDGDDFELLDADEKTALNKPVINDINDTLEGDATKDTDTEQSRILKNFIDTYESLPELWNPAHPSYKNKTRRNLALDKLVSIYKRIKIGADRVAVKRKINTLRSNYRKELNKILSWIPSSDNDNVTYTPTSWVFYSLQFLEQIEKPVNYMHYGKSVQQVNEVTFDGEQNSVGEQPLRASVENFTTRSSNVSPSFVKTDRTLNPVENPNDVLQASGFYAEQPWEHKDDIPTISKVWGEKLLTLEHQQRAHAEKAINDILFEASQGTLHRYSVTINQETKFRIPPSQRVFQQRSSNHRRLVRSVNTFLRSSSPEELEETLTVLLD